MLGFVGVEHMVNENYVENRLFESATQVIH